MIRKLIKKLLAPIIREVIKEREGEVIETISRVHSHLRETSPIKIELSRKSTIVADSNEDFERQVEAIKAILQPKQEILVVKKVVGDVLLLDLS